ncbi:MAG TPA: trypsin-like peptidase domain-containing protein [Kofleriaceae bacterium]|nr:trypsin-like peptidase domain-containing protein [Kofleriaceae bacterium]
MADAENPALTAEVTETLRRSVVKLFTIVKEPNYYQPWNLEYQKTSGGSACIVPGHRILTNAHVVSNLLYVQALKPGDSRKYTARVLHVDHDTETALLTVDDPEFFAGTVPVRFGELPFRNAKVSVYGFPMGGNELCITAGIVSRIEVRSYTHSQRHLLALQTDAAINPGNSGGPVFMNDELIGIAFQSYKQKDLEKSGYVVPIPIIRHLFEDLEDGEISGVPDLGIYTQKIENDAMRAYVGLSGGRTGVLVTRVVHASSADGVLAEGDVLTAIDGTPVASDGSVPLRTHDRVHFSYLVSRYQVGQSCRLEILRAGAARTVSVQLRKLVTLVPPPQPGHRPSYFIFAGLVFLPLTYDYMTTWKWENVTPRFKHYYYSRLPSARHAQVVLVNQVLAHDINVGYHQIHGAVVERINGIDIVALRDVPRALAAPLGGFHVIELDYHGMRGESSDYHSTYGTRIVIDAASAARATEEILAQNGIASDRSPDLK